MSKLVKRVLLQSFVGLLLLTNTYPVNATPIKAGAVCSKVGTTKKTGTQIFRCTQQGKKKLWVKIAVTPKATPTPTPTPTSSPSARSLTIYTGGSGATSLSKKSAELNFVPVTAAVDQNFKIWIYDPENITQSLNSPGIFYKLSNGDGNWTFIGANKDGTIFQKMAAGSYVLDTVEPNSNTSKYSRRTYSFVVDERGAVSFLGLQPNSLGIFTVTINLNSPKPTFVPKNQCQLLGQDGDVALNNGFPRRADRLPTSGVIRALMIPVDFPDVIGAGNPAEIYFDMAKGMDDFYRRISEDQVSFSFQILPNYLRMNFQSNAYNLGTWSGGDSLGYYKAAVAAADSYVDYSKFDVVYVLSPKNIPWSSIAYGPAFPMRIETSDGDLMNGSISGADAYQNFPGADWKWIAHETGHLFGLHDLYTTNGRKETYGSWDIMSLNWSVQAIELNAWNRYISDWLKESQIDCLTLDSLSSTPVSRSLAPLVKSLSGTKAQLIRLSSSKILVAEYRISGGFDVIPQSNEGVLIYTVDMQVPSIKGGWMTQRRSGSIKEDFTDATLKSGDSAIVEGIKIEVISLSEVRADIRISKS